MSMPTDERPALAPEDEALVRRVAAAYQPPAMTAARRHAFQIGLDARLARARRRELWPWLALAPVAAAALAWLVVARVPFDGLGGGRHAAVEDATPADDADLEAALLAMAPGSSAEAEADEALPEDYEAISTLFLGG